ncbi:MAG: YchJ family protein [Pseudobdellovibrionaceae bacterium]
MTNCPCGSERSYDSCCGLYHSGEENAPTAEKLMRSRYCAFVKKKFDYLEKTLDPQTFQNFDHEGNREWAKKITLIKLEILRAQEQGNKAVIEFKAHFLENEKELVHHEISKFRKQTGIWYFREGKVYKT